MPDAMSTYMSDRMPDRTHTHTYTCIYIYTITCQTMCPIEGYISTMSNICQIEYCLFGGDDSETVIAKNIVKLLDSLEY